jgi:hypothetical protein
LAGAGFCREERFDVVSQAGDECVDLCLAGMRAGKTQEGRALAGFSKEYHPSGVYADTVSVFAEMAMATLKEIEL